MTVTSAIPQAIDYLVAGTRALPEFAAPVVVSDGWPVEDGTDAIAIGVRPTAEDGTTGSDNTWAQLGAQMEREVFDIPCELASFVGGDSAKDARDAAFRLFDAFLTFVRSDRTLGGIQPGNAQVLNVDVDQTATPAEAGEGRVCWIKFSVRVDHRL